MQNLFNKNQLKIPTPIKCEELKTSIVVNSFHDPDYAWDMIKNRVKKDPVESLHIDTPIYDDKVRFVCISDTHSKTDKIGKIPAGDVLLHAGDFTSIGSEGDVQKFNTFLNSLNSHFKYKVVIAGNHELSFDKNSKNRRSSFVNLATNDNSDPRDLLTSCIYLEDSYVELFGYKIYGAPWQPKFCDWAFNLERGDEILQKWNMIPENTDILITHGPPMGFGDIVRGGYHVGCTELFSTIRDRVHPKIHLFGHIHEDYGAWTDGETTFINASTCNIHMKPINPAFIFDLPLSDGVTKDSFMNK